MGIRGVDREHMDLLPGSDDMIKAVVAVNPSTAVVIPSGTPVTMPWFKGAPAVIQAWYGGNETGHAIADVVFGKTNPSGKLLLSFLNRKRGQPSFPQLQVRTESGPIWRRSLRRLPNLRKDQQRSRFPFRPWSQLRDLRHQRSLMPRRRRRHCCFCNGLQHWKS